MLSLRKGLLSDFNFYYKLKCEPSSVYWGGFSEAPTVEGLESFWRKYVENCSDDREILILEDDGSPVGYVQAVFEEYDIGLSMGIIESARGKGYGKLIIARAVDYYKDCKTFFCFIREDNRASIGSFKASGFKEVDRAYKQYFPLDGKEFVMRRFELHR